MTLYHFTANHLIQGCLETGLTRGVVIVSIAPARFKGNWQWLTANPSWQQSWNTMTRLQYDRAEWRITIDFPERVMCRLKHWWTEGASITPLFDSLNAFGDPHNWWLYHGLIPAIWFTAVEHRPRTENMGTRIGGRQSSEATHYSQSPHRPSFLRLQSAHQKG